MNIRKNASAVLVAALIVLILTGCSGNYADTKTAIIDAEDALQLIEGSDVLLIDAQKISAYQEEHAAGAVNISRADIVVSSPVVNMLADKQQIEQVLGSRGINEDTSLLIYDNNNNMDAARLWWTLLVYGHTDMKVISGGLSALAEAGIEITSELPRITSAVYTAQERNDGLIADISEVLAQVNTPAEDVILIDTRTEEEFNAGTIPSSIHLNYVGNNYADGTYRKVQDIQIIYKEAGITAEDTVIMYCKTSIRGAQTYLALYNAGYRDLKLFDGAWVQWKEEAPELIQKPEVTRVQSNMQDNS